jgi:hypothetical protein
MVIFVDVAMNSMLLKKYAKVYCRILQKRLFFDPYLAKYKIVKNKHLVLLFLVVLAAGLLGRYLPWPYRHFFQADLIRIDPESLDWISITAPNEAELQFKKTDNGWVGEQNERTLLLPDSVVTTWIQPLFDMQSIRSAADGELDSSGLTDGTALTVQLRTMGQEATLILLGRVVSEPTGPATYVQIGQHVGSFLVRGNLRKPFQRNLSSFRQKGILRWEVKDLQACTLLRPALDTTRWIHLDSLHVWRNAQGLEMPDKQMETWFGQLTTLNQADFADQFDPLEHPEAACATFDFYTRQDSLRLSFYKLQRPDLPEDVRNYTTQSALWATYFVHSSQNKGNMFAMEDTTLARLILAGPAATRDTLKHDKSSTY